jgi:hypothetical protein
MYSNWQIEYLQNQTRWFVFSFSNFFQDKNNISKGVLLQYSKGIYKGKEAISQFVILCSSATPTSVFLGQRNENDKIYFDFLMRSKDACPKKK